MKKIIKYMACVFFLILSFSITFKEGNLNSKQVFNNEYFDAIALASGKPVITSAEVSIKPDLVMVKATPGSSAIAGYYIGTSTNYSSAKYYSMPGLSSVRFSAKNGTYYAWVKDNSGNVSQMSNPIRVTESCSNTKAVSAVGNGSVERCFIYNGTNDPLMDDTSDLATCASGYTLEAMPKITSDTCAKLSKTDLNLRGVNSMYCKRTYSYNCVKQATESDNSLSSLSLSTGNISPAFNSNTYVYNATVSANTSKLTIKAMLKDANSSFATGYAPRDVSLKYGLNTFYIKVTSNKGNVKTYTVKITRKDNRSSVNTLKSLSINVGSLSPTFQPNTTSYNATVAEGISSIVVYGDKTDSKSNFVSGYEPGTKNLKLGANKIQIKVKSESGIIKTYTINVTRGSASSSEGNNNLPTLSNITLSSGVIAFEANKTDYNVTVPFEVLNVTAIATPNDANDTILISGGDNLAVGNNEIVIKVTNTSNITNTYIINVVRLEENLDVKNPVSLKEIKIKGINLKFSPTVYEYQLTLKKGVTSLDIETTPSNEMDNVVIIGNENLTKGSKVNIQVTNELGESSTYVLTIAKVKGGTNWFFIIILIIIIVLFLVYIVLRMLGYQFYFNFAAIGAWFRSLKEKLFHRE